MKLKMFPDSYPSEDRISTRCCDLVRDWAIDWDKIIKEGRRYYTWPTNSISSILRQRSPHWTLLEVTCIRSGIIFFYYIEDKRKTEYWMPSMSDEAQLLHPAEIILDEYGFGLLRHKTWDTLHGRIKIV